VRGSDRYYVDGVSCRIDGSTLPVVDLSTGGFFVATERPPVQSPVVELELALGPRPPFRILGRVSWVNGPVKTRSAVLPPGFGVQITRIDFTDKLAIVDMLRRSPPARLRAGQPRANA
jgi:hypothetical protein